MPSYSELVVRYRYIRELGKSMSRGLMDRASKGGYLKEAGHELGLLRKGVFVFDNETEGALLFDYAIYNVQRDGGNVVQALLAEHVYPDGSEEANHLHDLNNAWYSLFVIERMEPGVGAHVRDLIRKTTHLLIDLGVGQSGGPGNLMASRVVPRDGFIMSTGAILPLAADLESCQRPIADIVKRYCSKNNDTPRHLSAAEEKSLARSIISTGLNAGLSRRMRYRDAGQPINDDDLLLDDDDGFGRSPVPVRTGGRVGRNDPCMCGSGRKFKHCCGKG